MADVIKITMENGTDGDHNENAWKEVLTIKKDGISFAYLPCQEEYSESRCIWKYQTDSVEFRNLFLLLSFKYSDFERLAGNEILDEDPIVVTFHLADGDSFVYKTCEIHKVKDFTSIIDYMIPQMEARPLSLGPLYEEE